MKKILSLLPLILLCGCLTTQPPPPEPVLEPPKEPELAVKVNKTLTSGETEVIDLKAGDIKPPVEKPVVMIKTDKGEIIVELDAEKAPLTVKNFLSYVDKKFYDGTIFHRVIPNFMIQGGGFSEKMLQKATKEPIKNEAFNGLSNTRGTIAMARTNRVDSATSQFFINVVNNKNLDHRDHSARNFGYCVFGKVISGMDVVDEIRKVKTGTRGFHRDVPVENVLIKEISRLKKVD